MRNLRLSVLLLAAVAGACADQSENIRPPQTHANVIRAPGVEPADKLNERFTDPALDPAVWKARFEREGREVYAQREAIVAALQLRPGMVVADVGTGTGAFLPGLSAAVGSAGRVHALDISDKLIAYVRGRSQAEGLANVSARVSGQDDVGLAEASVDLIFVCDTYHHFENPVLVLASIRRALKPGGHLVVVDFHRIIGLTRPFLMTHVRAGREVFASEIEAAGFRSVTPPDTPYLKENYMLRFERPED